MTRFPGLVLALVAAVGLLFASGGQATPGQSTTLHGRVGPGFSIVLTTESGARVTKLDPGTYEIDVDDLAEEHNFHLFGPGVDKATEIGDTGTVHWTVTFRDGTYTYQCDPHQGTMNGSFTVGNVPTQQPPPQKPPGRRGHAEDEARPHVGAGLHDHAQDDRREDREVDEDRHVHRRRARPQPHPQRPRHRTRVQPRDEAADLLRDADVEGEARADRDVPIPMRPARPHGDEGLGEDRRARRTCPRGARPGPASLRSRCRTARRGSSATR